MSSENLAGRTIAGYRLLERVGEGGTAEVYRAEHPERGPCAFKVLRQRLRGDPTAVKRFLREAGYGSRVRHPGVVRTYEYGEADGLHYLALEWAEGKSLADYVHRAERLAPAQVGRMVRQLADALSAAHQAGIIHRDLKPENIIYDAATERVKLLDFGIARDAELPAEERLTRTGFFVGTLQYVAPEALSGELVDGRADIFSLATITYWLLTGVHPYTGRTPRELFQQLLEQLPRGAPRVGVDAGEQPVCDRGEAEDVGPAVHQFPGEGFGCHVLERPHEEPGPGEPLFSRQLRVPRDPEVEQLDPLGRRVINDILGFQVPVDDARLVGRAQGVRELAYHAPDLRRSEALRAVYVIGERFPLCPLQREVMQTVGLAVFVGAHHARMPDARAVAGLPQEAFHRRGVAPQTLSQYLERAGAALRVLGPVDFGRASLTDALEEAVAGDGPAGEVFAGHGNARN